MIWQSAGIFLLAFSASALADSAPGGKIIGLALTGRHIAMHETPGAKQECPAGLQFNTIVDTWTAQFPTEEAQTTQLKKCGSRYNRGPNCENVYYNPAAVEDRLPFHESQSRIGYGLNLDGTPDGRETPKSCTHQKFAGPNGESGIDNQLARIEGCDQWWRSDGVAERYSNNFELLEDTAGRVLIEISNVDDELNDPDVEVTLYKGKDLLTKDSSGKVAPWQSQAVDEKVPQYIQHTRGKIVDSVLITQPIDARLPAYEFRVPGEIELGDMQLRLKLAPDGAQGLLAGYQEIDKWWELYTKVNAIDGAGSAPSQPAKYAALHRLADGAKDPKTGQCGAFSAAYNVEWVRVFVTHPASATSVVKR